MKTEGWVFLAVAVTMLVGMVLFVTNQRQEETIAIDTTQVESKVDEPNSMYAQMKGDEFDKAYLADMISHHQGALNMASRARMLSTSNEIRGLSEAIITSQSDEVRQMLAWQAAWGFLGTDSSDPHAGHAMEGGGNMGAEMADMEARLENLTGAEFDKEFLTQMIRHHQQAVEMSRYAETNAKRQDIKDFSKGVIREQEKEIADMKRWQGQ